MIPSFVIYLREGIEASMIIAILLSYLKSIDQRQHFRDVFVGVGAATILLIAGGIAAYSLVHHYDGSNVQTYFETATYVLATVALTYMTLWMAKHARTIASELRARSELALTRGTRWGLGILAFQAVGREGLETMVFTLAIVFSNSRQGATPVHGSLVLVGAGLGLLLSLALAVAIYRLGTRLNLKQFFRVLGTLLIFFAAGLLADAIENLQQLGWLPFGAHVLWNSSGSILESSSVGDVLHSLLGYSDRPTALQVGAWIFYVASSVTVFVRIGRVRPDQS
ncbi:MAG: FTR1 family iron permease [Acidimicrobiales bacterium]